MLFNLKAELLPVLKNVDFSDLIPVPEIIDARGNSFVLKVADAGIEDFLVALNYEISLDGMDEEQNNVNEYGKKLYQIYDEIMLQLKN